MEQLCFFSQGKWIIDIDNDIKMLRCSNCNNRYFLKPFLYSGGKNAFRFCGYCGASMFNCNQKIIEFPVVRDSDGDVVY